MTKFDVIVIGGGHAGVEAAAAAARIGKKTLLITMNTSDIGAMSCNPSIGGPGKSGMVAEIDAFGGVMPVAADASAIHWRMLNANHGAATRALRAQIDREKYRVAVIAQLKKLKTLTIVYESVFDFDIKNKIVNNKYQSGAIVITTGTFLCGVVHRGVEKIESGRLMDDGNYQDADKNLSGVLRAAGFDLIRLKTGTPARIFARSIDFSKCEIQPSDMSHGFFSSAEIASDGDKLSNCFITKTTEETHKIIRECITDAPMYNGEIVGTGPRYCPSLEDKVMRFPAHNSHHIFLEPEGENSDLIYPNGISTSFGAAVQDKFICSIPGLENAEIERYGYAIEYDAIDARALNANLESYDYPGVFFAGQINGTSGYEEAAAQGLVAGSAAGGAPLNLTRANSLIGVMIDDITTLGVDEPYRMFSSRAEYRLSLRADNAVQRLGKLATDNGLIAHDEYEKKLNARAEIVVENDKLYAGYIARNAREIETYNRDRNIKIPRDFEYENLPGLTNELVEKLTRARPENIAALSRIPGMTPAGIMTILRRVKRG
ncbi:MAG: tRNA uridine-5-carboxymethylaminomethyl(34) synthesis enzyme MnmG [Rickettsiales bacterium]|jgi:tRNA uridine 5-carboxymethylaminomethyl modification enzyme|nr:tRNA uridine-5-carboxymethylaminomethyl(34) synthesis enzyme MnmG [Rickettsiales bacterium]